MSAAAADGTAQGILRAEGRGVSDAAHDGFFWLALALGGVGWFLPEPHFAPAVWGLAAKALLEETVFRGLAQEIVHRALGRRSIAPGLSLANVLVSACFAGLHVFGHGWVFGLSVFLPSLVFGWAWDRWRSVGVAAAIHCAYNLFYYYRFVDGLPLLPGPWNG